MLDALLRFVSADEKGEIRANEKRRKPLRGIVIDADALRLIASGERADALMQKRDPETACILTPHLAEFADLVHKTVAEAGRERIPLLRQLADRYQCTVIGKDARTLIVSKGVREITMITNGNSGMATAGSGDVLTGITAAMLMAVTGSESRGHRAAQAAAYIHAEAGDACKRRMGERAMLAGDLIRAEESVFHAIESAGL
jgi:NAD(P)H-hydrate epimerase